MVRVVRIQEVINKTSLEVFLVSYGEKRIGSTKLMKTQIKMIKRMNNTTKVGYLLQRTI